MTVPLEGLLLVDKPSGVTSHDAVDVVRRLGGERRVGHAGTLDPGATGLLPIAIGRATRLIRFLPHAPKVYEGTIRLGLTTTTDDLEGEPISRHPGPLPSAARVLAGAAALRGPLLQTPPRVSAKHVGGERLYRLTRRGESVEAPPAPVEVFRLDLAPGEREADWEFTAEVSEGTYIRALARDLGAALGCGAALARLRRVAIGPFRVESAVALAALEAGGRATLEPAVAPLETMPLEAARVPLGDDAACARFLAGVSLPSPSGTSAEGFVAVFAPSGALLGMAEIENGLLQPRVVLGR